MSTDTPQLRTILVSQILPDTPESDNTHPDTRPCAPEVPDLSDPRLSTSTPLGRGITPTSPIESISPTEVEEDHDDIGIDIQTGAGPRIASERTGEETRVQTRLETRIDALAWLGRATLDVIGLAGTYSYEILSFSC